MPERRQQLSEELIKRLQELEGRQSALRFEFDAFNTRVERYMKDQAIGVETLNRIEGNLKQNSDRTDEMYEIFMGALMGFKVLGWIGKKIMGGITLLGRIAKPLFYIFAFAIAGWGYLAGKGWQWPLWIKFP